MELIAIMALFAIVIVLQYFSFIERQDLLNRLYSKDFVEYKAFESTDKSKKVEEKEVKRKEFNWLWVD